MLIANKIALNKNDIIINEIIFLLLFLEHKLTIVKINSKNPTLPIKELIKPTKLKSNVTIYLLNVWVVTTYVIKEFRTTNKIEKIKYLFLFLVILSLRYFII